MGVNRALGGGLCRLGTPHEPAREDCRPGHTLGVYGDWIYGLAF